MLKYMAEFAALCLICVVCACGKSPTDENIITVSIPAQKWLLDSIVGTKYKVVSMLGSDSNPETFEPSMRQLMDLQHSRIFFTVGKLSFEQSSMPKITENFPDLLVVETSTGIQPIEGTHSHGHDGEHHHDADPHVWSSLPNARIMARNMYEQIVKLDPKNKDYYTARYTDLDKNLATLHDSIATILKPVAGTTFLVWHPSLSYFAHDYDLHQVGMESAGKESSPAQYRHQLDMAHDANALLFFTQSEYDPRQAQSIADELHIPTAPVTLMQADVPAQIRTLAHELLKAHN